jgi:flagellar protein FliL
MSTATADAATAAPKGKKKLIIIIAAALVVLGGGGGAAALMMGKKAQAEADGDGEAGPAKAAPRAVARHDPKAVPTFVPLDPFTVNLADRESERYAQVGITLEIDDAKLGDQLKAFMPAIRNNILLAIADKTAAELLAREGKTKLAGRIQRETARAIGIHVEEPDEDEEDEEENTAKKKKKKKKAPEMLLPIRAVHFSTFIVQ